MRYKMSREDVYKMGYPVVKLPARAMQSLLYGIERIGYNSGIYGWNWDAYFIHGVVFCEGYRNLPGYLTKEERTIIASYEEKAREAWMKDYSFATTRDNVYSYLCELCEKIKADRA